MSRNIMFLQDFMPSLRLANWAPPVLRRHLGQETESIESLCAMTMKSDGEFSSLLLAERILKAYETLDDAQKLAFFEMLHDDFDVDADAIQAALDHYRDDGGAAALRCLTRAADPLRRELLRRINLAPDGTRRLVRMREDLLGLLGEHPRLKKADNDFRHLFNAWFNRGFLLMEPIDWTTPAHILEKIIAYEAVHQIESWAALRKRLKPLDRYCYAFFHPSMQDEPLVFVEIALTDQMPRGIGEILERDDQSDINENPACAAFYSISNCHAGLSGVSFGNFLIKQVATNLKLRFPSLKTFATISPVPGLRRWLDNAARADASLAEFLDDFDAAADGAARERMERLAARYLVEEKDEDGNPLDPVARFHLKNGAMLERINVLGDPSETGMRGACGTMVNYVYDLARVEENHEDFVHNHRVICSSAVRKLVG